MFHPPHCPNPECEHYQSPISAHWFRNRGYYTTIAFDRVPRFRCRACGKDFSKQTFSIDYYAKKTLDYPYIYNQINAGAGIRNIARDLGVNDQSIINRINRMARSALLISQMLNGQLDHTEDLVIDGLQNFCTSQYFPDNYTILVGKDSQFVYECDYAIMRRGGRMSEAQKKKRMQIERIFKPSPRAIERSFTRLTRQISRMRPRIIKPLILYTDEKSDYRRSLWKDQENRERMFSGDWRHHMTNSKLGRNTRNPLFSANYIDREIRKDMASLARETVQFPRNASNAMLRMSLYLFDHNVRKPYRIRDEGKSRLTHAEVAGIPRERLDELLLGFFERRVFKPVGLELSEPAWRTLNREWVTPLKRRKEVCWRYLAA